jgi:hypothetical protein
MIIMIIMMISNISQLPHNRLAQFLLLSLVVSSLQGCFLNPMQREEVVEKIRYPKAKTKLPIILRHSATSQQNDASSKEIF